MLHILRTSGFGDGHGPLVQLSGSGPGQNCATHVLQTVKVPMLLYSQHTSSSGIHLHSSHVGFILQSMSVHSVIFPFKHLHVLQSSIGNTSPLRYFVPLYLQLFFPPGVMNTQLRPFTQVESFNCPF